MSDVKSALARLLTQQRAFLELVRRRADGLSPSDLTDAWERVESASACVATAAHEQGVDDELASELARARALSGLLAAELGVHSEAVAEEIARVRDARRRVDALRRRATDAGHSCDVSG